MKMVFPLLAPLLLASTLVGQEDFVQLRNRLDRLTQDLDTKFLVLDRMAADLGTHRNRLVLLKKESGLSFVDVYSNELRKRGATEKAIAEKLGALASRVKATNPGWTADNGPQLISYIGATVDHNSAGTFFTLAPEAGVDFGRIALVAGLPVYRISSTQRNATGLGDLYVSAFVRQAAGRYHLASAFTVMAPTGDKDAGLGAGRVSVDLNGTVQRRFGNLRPFLTGGYTNSTFNNVGYQRPFISNGNALYTSGGIDNTIRRRVVVGLGGFALHAIGSQTVISQMVEAPHTGQSAGGGPPSMPGIGHGGPGNNMMPGAMPAGAPFYSHAAVATVAAESVSDHGATGWASWTMHAGWTLNVRVAYSVPYKLTTLRLGVGVDLSRPLSRLFR
jgi:hypothetical protein